MKRFFAKFAGLPFKIAVTRAANFEKAKEYFAQYRGDAVVYKSDEKIISGDDFVDQKYRLIDVSNYPETEYYKVRMAASGSERICLLPKLGLLGHFRQEFSVYANAEKHGNIWSLDKKTFVFGVKNSPKLVKQIKDVLGVEETPEYLKNMQALVPLAFFEVTKKPENALMLEDRIKKAEIDDTF